MAEEIHFGIGHFRNFDGPVTFTLTLDDLGNHIVENELSTSTNTIYWLVATLRLNVDGRTYERPSVRPDRRMDGHFLTNSVISAYEQR